MLLGSKLMLVLGLFEVFCGFQTSEAELIPADLENDATFPFKLIQSAEPENRIVGGEESVRNSRPYQVGLIIPVGLGNSFCGGSLINEWTVLTAAHCVDNVSDNVTIYLGAHNMVPTVADNATSRSSRDIVLHPQWSRPTLMNDIALIRFAWNPVPLGRNISTVLLPRDNMRTASYVGNTTLVSGWGKPSDAQDTISPVLREVSSHVISNTACNLAYTGLIRESHICISGGLGRSTCNGDSGGPLVINGVQVGVVSFGIRFGCEVGWPPVFARVTSYLDWIRDNQANATPF